MKRMLKAVMHCTATQFSKLIVLGNKVIKSLGANAAIFPSPSPTVAVLTTEVGILETALGEAKTGDHAKVEARNKQARKVFKLLQQETGYVNGIAQGDQTIILLSGFDASAEPSPHGIPDKPVIKRIENGGSLHSAKIFLAKITSPLLAKKDKLTFIVEMSTDDSKEENWKTVLQTTNSRKLIILKLTRGQEVFFRIAAMNTKGQSDWSEKASFVSQ